MVRASCNKIVGERAKKKKTGSRLPCIRQNNSLCLCTEFHEKLTDTILKKCLKRTKLGTLTIEIIVIITRMVKFKIHLTLNRSKNERTP